jgi:hypothetical protein
VKTTGSVAPTGTVNISWDGYSIGTATPSASGVASLTKSNLNVYTYPLSGCPRYLRLPSTLFPLFSID